MRVLICVDMEGIAGIYRWEQVTGACVKWGTGRYAARHLTPSVACNLIETSVTEALKPRNLKKLKVHDPRPAVLKVELATPDRAAQYMGKVGVEIEGPRTVVSRGENFWQCWDQFWAH